MVKKSLSGDLHKNGKRGRHGIKSDTVLVRTELKNGVSPNQNKDCLFIKHLFWCFFLKKLCGLNSLGGIGIFLLFLKTPLVA